ncbi:MAG: hypothetical protein U0835_22695 [Isosphaeraceae bacterium]
MRTPLEPDSLERLEAELQSLRPLPAGDALRSRVAAGVSRRAAGGPPLAWRNGGRLSTAAGLAALTLAGLWGLSRREPPPRPLSATPPQGVTDAGGSACECRVRFSAGTPLRSGGFG